MTAIAIKSVGVYLARKTGLVVLVDIAPNVLTKEMRWLRDKLMLTDIMHGQPLSR